MADYFDIPEDLQVVNYDPEEEQQQYAAQELERQQLTQGREQQAAEAQAAQQEMEALEAEALKETTPEDLDDIFANLL